MLVTSQKMGTRIAYNPVGLRPGTRPPRRHSSVAYRDTNRVRLTSMVSLNLGCSFGLPGNLPDR